MNRRSSRKERPTHRQRKSTPASTPSSPFAVVGIGASAGGLAAMTEFLKTLPRGIRAAFVIIQHLDPTHGSLTSEILSRISPLPVSEVTDGMRIEAGHVYVIPPNCSLRLEHELLKLSPRAKGQRHLPIDLFFESLARERKDTAIGVVLSGIASDGTNGVQAIKAAGGFTCAQDPGTAQYDSMPRSAISSGAIDVIDNPATIAREISERLLWSIAHPGVSRTATPVSSPLKPDGVLRKIFALIRKATGVDFAEYKPSTIRRRIGRRLSLQKIERLQTYADYLDTHPEEVKALFSDLLIHVTGFFRDPDAYEVLKTRILPKYMETFAPGDRFRVWVPGCASGEEAYSIAIALFEFLDNATVRPPIQIFASDISEASLHKARDAVYPESIVKEVSRERLRRFFEKVGGGYRVAKWIRETCLFSRHDLTVDPPFAKIDLISCRNVLIYFGSELQKRVVPVFHYALKPGGIFWLGRSEAIAEFSNFFTLQDRASRFYLKKGVTAALTLRLPVRGHWPDAPPAPSGTVNLQDVLRESDRAAVRQYAPAAVVIDDALQVLNVNGRLAPFLELAPGHATLNILRLAHPDIVSDLRYLIDSARRENAPVTAAGLTMTKDGEHTSCDIRIVPLHLGGELGDRYFSIFFEEAAEATAPQISRPKAGRARPRKDRRRVRDLNSRRLFEEYQATQEELTSSNEELQSTNEELQSINEELETAKEELQSANEELTTTNDELQLRNTELVQVTNDLTNLLASMDAPIVMVGSDTRIRRFTPSAGQMLNLIPGDVGRPIGGIKPSVHAPDLDDLANDVMAGRTGKELETQDKEGRWYRLQIRPYRTGDDRIDGVVFVFTDITALKRAAEVLTIARDDARHIIEMMPNPILVIDSDLRVQLVNSSFSRMFDVRPDEANATLLSELGDGSWNVPFLEEKLKAVLREGATFTNVELDRVFPRIGRKSLVLHATTTRLTGAGTNTALVAIEDLTRSADRLRHAEENYRLLLENAHDGILIVDQSGLIDFANRHLEEIFGYAPGELRNRPYELLIPDQYAEAHRKHHADFMRHPVPRDVGRGIDLFGTRKDGTILPVEISLSPTTVDSSVMITAIVRDVSARKKIEAERLELLERETKARREAEKANQLKDEFLATLSHELRTPLTAILGWTQLLRLDTTGSAGANRAVEMIEKSAINQSQLIDDLLDVSRIQAGKVHLTLSRIDPVECVVTAIDATRKQAEDEGITIDTDFDSSPCLILADSSRLQQVFRNLLGNAVKFTAPGGRVTVRSRPLTEPGRVEIQVQDTGKGIKPEFLPYVFKRFSQEDSSPTRAVGGLGLGLSIVWNLVEMHGGTVTVASPGEGQGAVFAVTLPCAESRPGLNASDNQGKLAERTDEPARLNGLRVLVIDDDPDTRETIAALLEFLGAQVRLAESARDGVAAVISDRPDVVLCDISMPGEDGFSVIRKVRALETTEGGHVPMVAVTAYAEAEMVRRCLDAGFDAHLAKPMDIVNLSSLVTGLAGAGGGTSGA